MAASEKSENQNFCDALKCVKMDIPERWDPRPGTRDPGPLGGAQDPGPLKWDLGPGTSKFSSGTRDPVPLKWDVNE